MENAMVQENKVSPANSYFWKAAEKALNNHLNIDELTVCVIPKIGSKWKHTIGIIYTVLYITNIGFRNQKYPVTVVYQGCNEKVWSRPLSEWHRSFTEIIN